jgi:hypothetical protein
MKMSKVSSTCFGRFFCLAIMFASLFGMGCQDPGRPHYPVSGRITYRGRPIQWQTTTIVLKPMAAKAGPAGLEPVGKVDFEGNYEVYTGQRKGAPSGSYKVVVTAHDTAIDLKNSREKRPVASLLLPVKYASVETTDLQIEVVPNPVAGAYDLKLAKDAEKSAP